MSIHYISESQYVMHFSYDYTKIYFVYFLKGKYQAFETFRYFHVWIQNEAQLHIFSLHVDSGREQMYNELGNFIFQHRIICPYNPQQNVVVEGMSITFLNMVCVMMFLTNIKLTFLDDAIMSNICEKYMSIKLYKVRLIMKSVWAHSIGKKSHGLWFHLLCLDP